MSKPPPSDVPRTHRWRRRPESEPAPEPLPRTPALPEMPAGDGLAPADLEAAICRSLRGWDVLVLKLVGSAAERATLGRQAGRWLRGRIGTVIDATLCRCGGERCVNEACPANQLLGQHDKGNKPGSDGWAPLSVRGASMEAGTIEKGAQVRCELVLVGHATRRALALIEALQDDAGVSGVQWNTFRQLTLDEDGDLRWRKISREVAPIPLPLPDLVEPRLRKSRLMISFQTPTSLSRSGREEDPTADLAIIIDRMARTLATWSKRSGHDGPPFPIDDLRLATRGTELAADHTQIVRLAGRFVGKRGAMGEEEGVPLLVGSASWRGDFAGLGVLLRTAHWLGIGPGREHGMGEITVR